MRGRGGRIGPMHGPSLYQPLHVGTGGFTTLEGRVRTTSFQSAAPIALLHARVKNRELKQGLGKRSRVLRG